MEINTWRYTWFKNENNLAICKSRNGESGNGMWGMMGMRGIRVGMMEMRGIRVGMWRIRVEMRGTRVGMRYMFQGDQWFNVNNTNMTSRRNIRSLSFACPNICVRSWYEAIGKRHIQNPWKHLRWSILPNLLTAFTLNCFHKTLHLKYLKGFWIRLWLLATARISQFILVLYYFLKSQLTQY